VLRQWPLGEPNPRPLEIDVCNFDPRDSNGARVSYCGGATLTFTCFAGALLDSLESFQVREVLISPGSLLVLE